MGSTPSQFVHGLIQQGKSFSGRERNCCFLNAGARRFANVSALSGLDFDDDGRAIGIVDWDFDGDLDAWFVNRSGPQVRYLRNDLPIAQEGRRFLALKLQGTACNRDAIGARVEVHLRGQAVPLLKTLRAGDGFLSQSSKWLHFGLGPSAEIDRVVVRWPGSKPQTLAGLVPDRWYRVVQGREQAERWEPPQPVAMQPSPLPLEIAAEPPRVLLSEPVPLPPLDFTLFGGQGGPSPGRPSPGRVEKLRGKPALLVLWTSWCPTCAAELKDLNERRGELAAKGVVALALSVDGLYDNRTGMADAAKLLDKVAYRLPAGMAGKAMLDILQLVHDEVFDRHPPLGLPCSFLIDAEGRLAAIYRGRIDTAALLTDVGQLESAGKDGRLAALAFPGQWASVPVPRRLLPIAQKLAQLGLVGEAWDYISQHKARMRPEAEYASLLSALGHGLAQRGAAGPALEALNESVELAPQSAAAHYGLALVLESQLNLAKAATHFAQAARLDPKNVEARQSLAWVLATSSDPSVRNGREAVRWAKEAVALTGENDPACLDVLAIAHAALGEFDQALAVEEKAVKAARSTGRQDIIPQLQTRMEAFRNKRPLMAAPAPGP
jgi:tetratricopeptide (TPR) repeat protein